jgi:hypothetical protein
MEQALAPASRSRKVAKRDHRVRRLAGHLRKVMPWLAEPDSPAVVAWAELEVLAREAYSKLRETGILTDSGEPRQLLESYQRLRKTQLSYERELGMTPRSRAEISGGTSRVTIDAVAERVRRIHAARNEVEDVQS